MDKITCKTIWTKFLLWCDITWNILLIAEETMLLKNFQDSNKTEFQKHIPTDMKYNSIKEILIYNDFPFTWTIQDL